MIRNVLAFVLALAMLTPTLTLAQDEPTDTLTSEQTGLNLKSFDYVWTTIRDKHFDTTFGGVDWQAAFDELRPRVEEATTMAEARQPFYDLIGRLGLSHFGIIPSQIYDNIDRPAQEGDRGGETGIDLRVLDEEAVVVRVQPGTPAEMAGVKPGWQIIQIDDEEIAPLFPPLQEKFGGTNRLDIYLNRAVTSRLSGAIGGERRVVFLDGNGQRVELTLALAEPIGKRVLFGNLPPFYLTHGVDTLEQGIGYFTFSCFFDPVLLMGAFNKFMKSFQDAPGIVIDIRGNPGGIGGLAVGMAGWLVQEKNLYLGTFSTREVSLKLVVNARAGSYSGPVAVLVDGLSGSSSEFFAGGVQDIGRGAVFGTRTVGAALPSTIERLDNGDGFQYVLGDYVSASGRPLEGEGVIPDHEVRHTREALLEGRDLPLEAALEWIKKEASK